MHLNWRVFFFWLGTLDMFFVVVPVCLICIFKVDWLIDPKKNVTDQQKRKIRISASRALMTLIVQLGAILCVYLYFGHQ
jgi:hypothetical protein